MHKTNQTAASVRIARLQGEIKPSKGDDLRDVLKKPDGERLIHEAIESAKEWEPPPKPSASDRLQPAPPGELESILSDRGRNDTANAKRFVKLHGENIRRCELWGEWLVWDGQRWRPDRARRIEHLAKDVSKNLFEEVADLIPKLEDGAIGPLFKFARDTANARNIGNFLRLAKSEPGVSSLPEEFDRDPWKLNVHNGTIDLRTGELLPHRREDWITKMAAVEFDSDATAPTWERTINEIFQGDTELIEYVRRAMGYSLTGDTSERCFHFLFGTGRNGKTTIVATLQTLLGEYATTLRTEVLMAQRHDSHPTELCDLAGTRMAVSAETEDGRRFAESLVKQLTGGEDRIKARRMHQNPWEFRATHKLWISGNHKPRVSGTDDAIWDRIHLVPFRVRFSDPDKELPRKLEAELPGILNWALAGCLQWQESGLNPPASVTAAVASYRNEQDLIGAFIDEWCWIGGEDIQETAKALRDAYASWCEGAGEKPVSAQKFGRAITERGYGYQKQGGTAYRIGLKLKTPEEIEQAERFETSQAGH